ncbi:uncharacterized protein LOC126379367 isoform X2 [Pectinophora gossypiella]|nr:uncharacterized protein LOC126379367 isoform X2 [Pectinophora gossypiella]XP_049884044.1 uncharacterized protein LOC126379367 isoform X2 [Pectinophora gossypiella]
MPNPEAEDTPLMNQIPFYVLNNDLQVIRTVANRRPDLATDNGDINEEEVENRVYFFDAIPNERDLLEDQSIVEYKVVNTAQNMENEYDMYCSTPTDTGSDIDDDLSEPDLEITLQEVPNGVIVNWSCYLPWSHWHTLVPSTVSEALLECVVCAEYCERESPHVESSRHAAALANARPKHKFDLALTRKIRDKYHCAVCNEAFEISEENNHFSSKTHEGNLLFSINKASDILDNSDYKNSIRNDTYQYRHLHQLPVQTDQESVASDTVHDNQNYINFQNNYDDFYEDDIPQVTYEFSYATMAKKPKAPVQNFIEVNLGDRKVNVRYDSWHMIIKPQPNKFWCMVCRRYDHLRHKSQHCEETEHLSNLDKCKLVEAYGEYFIRQVNSDDKLYHCGHCNNLQWNHEMDDHLESVHPRRARNISETAKPVNSPANKPTNTSNNTTRNTDNNAVKNTNTPTKNTKNTASNNNAVKNTNTPTKNTKNTASNNNAVKNTNTPTINTKNTPSNNHSPDNIKCNANNDKVGCILFQGSNITPVPNAIPPVNYIENYTNAPHTAMVIISPFGLKMAVHGLNYNVICRRVDDFYCGLCDMVIPDTGVLHHMYNMNHIELLLRIPFIIPFSSNLIRAIRSALHCTLCNLPIPADNIYIHTKQPQHTTFLQNALRLARNSNINEVITANNIRPNITPNPNIRLANPVGNFNNIQEHNNNIQAIINNRVAFNNSPVNAGINQISPKNTQGANKPLTNTKVFNNSQEMPKSPTVKDKQEVETDTKTINTENDATIPRKISESEEYKDDSNESFESVASEEATFDFEEYVYLRLKNTYFKVSNTSYNTLVSVGDGSRYCFVCAQQVKHIELQKHVDSRAHLENMEKYRFIDKYEDHLLRQIYLMYHCSVCNIILSRRELKSHLVWVTHALQNDSTVKNITNNKKTRKTDVKGGVKQIVVTAQKENIYLQEKERKIKVLVNADIINAPQSNENAETNEVAKKSKIIIFNDNVLKIVWDSWHGISKIKNGYKCSLCQKEVEFEDIEAHCNSEWHQYGLDKPFDKQYAPALIRKVTDVILNCLICNTEVSNKKNIILEHINGKKHIKNYDVILKESSMANTYTDCHDDVLTI